VLISKIIQSAANMVTVSDKESYMQAFNPFIEQHRQELISFFTSFAEVKGLDSISPLVLQPSQKAHYIQLLLDHLIVHRDALAHLIPSTITPLLTSPPPANRQLLTRSQTLTTTEQITSRKPRSSTIESPKEKLTRGTSLIGSLSENDIEQPLAPLQPTSKQQKMLQKSVSERFSKNDDDNVTAVNEALAELRAAEDYALLKKKGQKKIEHGIVNANRRFEKVLENFDVGEDNEAKRSPDTNYTHHERDRSHTHSSVPPREKAPHHRRHPGLTEHKKLTRQITLRESGGIKHVDDIPDVHSDEGDRNRRRTHHGDSDDDRERRPRSLHLNKPLASSCTEERQTSDQ